MKKFIFLFGFILCLISSRAQRFVHYSADSSWIKYAAFEESATRDMTSEDFFTTFLRLDSRNRFVPSDTIYSPDSSYTYIKYRQHHRVDHSFPVQPCDQGAESLHQCRALTQL